MKTMIMQLKHLFDILISLTLLVVLALPFGVISLMILLKSGRPVFFLQERAGLHGKPFRVVKFRTMIRNSEGSGMGVFTEENDPRITTVGRFLRKFSIDELPQLINVLKGEMSLVGPRPTLTYQVERYSEKQRRRLLMKPGITGWAQVNGRNSLTWPERIELDVWYVENWSMKLDFLILIKTLTIFFKSDGVYGRQIDEISQVDEDCRKDISL